MINRVFHISCIHTLLQWTAGMNPYLKTYFIRRLSFRNRQYQLMMFAIIATLLSSCSNDPEQIRQLTESRNLKEDRAKGITAIYSKNGVVKAQLSAALYVKNPAAKMPYTDLNKDIKVDFYGDSGQVVHQLTADSCRFYDNDGNALVAGSLYFNSVSGAMQVYTGSAWVAAYVSGTGFLASANNLSYVASTSFVVRVASQDELVKNLSSGVAVETCLPPEQMSIEIGE
jgi:hypothetical protein